MLIFWRLTFGVLTCFLFLSCAKVPEAARKALYVNPFSLGSHEHFQARLDYNETLDLYKNTDLYEKADPSKTEVRINLQSLRGVLLDEHENVLFDYPVTGGSAKYPTPMGKYKILEKIKDKESNIYGKILNSKGVVIKGDADLKKDEIPPKGSFDGADMPYWMRLTNTGIGMHQGRVPSQPRRGVSHGCIRHTFAGVKGVYRKVRVGTPVIIF